MKQPRLVTPTGTCDCHLHVFPPVARYPYAEGRAYTPDEAPFEAYKGVMDRLGLERAVVVQPSVYGSDNRATLDAVGLGGKGFRAVAVLGDEPGDRDLEEMHEAGVRGVRVNALFAGAAPPADLRSLAERIAPLGWHLQLLIDVSDPGVSMRGLGALPVEIVFDHMGHVPATKALGDPGFEDLLGLMRDGRAWVKLSGAYRISARGAPGYEDVRPLAEALIDAAPDRVIWGSDWPHPAIEGPAPEAADLLDLLLDWIPDDETRHRVLVDNPARLYGFD